MQHYEIYRGASNAHRVDSIDMPQTGFMTQAPQTNSLSIITQFEVFN